MVPDANGAFHTLSACHYGKRGAQRILMILRPPRGLENQASPQVVYDFQRGAHDLRRGQVTLSRPARCARDPCHLLVHREI